MDLITLDIHGDIFLTLHPTDESDCSFENGIFRYKGRRSLFAHANGPKDRLNRLVAWAKGEEYTSRASSQWFIVALLLSTIPVVLN